MLGTTWPPDAWGIRVLEKRLKPRDVFFWSAKPGLRMLGTTWPPDAWGIRAFKIAARG
jgi:hypothetical protein